MRLNKKQLKKNQLWVRIRYIRLKRWWFRNDMRYGLWWRVGNAAMAALVLVAVVIPVFQQLTNASAYRLSADTLKLVGATDQTLAKQLTYDGSTQTYQFNKAAIKSDDSSPAAQLESQVGTANGQGKNKSLYALDVPQALSKGVTYHDVNSGLSFSLVPEFRAAEGQEVQGHLVFPLSAGAQAIYTLKNNGLKEDIVVQKAVQDTMTFGYTLNLPSTLQAKVIPNSDGAIGVYSADPALFGNISYGSDADRASVQKARVNGAKTYLVFGLPSPVIKNIQGNTVGTARFVLNGNRLSVVASGLSGQTAPVTIDPSVVVSSTSDFQAGNAEDNIDFGISGQATRGGLTGGAVSGGWSSAGSSLGTARYGAATVAYDGYLYEIGGCTAGTLTSCSGSYLSDIQYIAINSNGTLSGSWASAGSSFTTGRFGLSAVAYNGYLYILGGNGGSNQNDIQYIAINSNGTLSGSWASAGSFTNARYFQSAVAYNGYLYVLGGYDGSTYYSDVQYATFNANGTVGSWASAGSSFTTGRFGLSAVAYNGYLYVLGGCSAGTCSTYKADVQYVALSASGTITGSWATTTSFATARFDQGVVASNGYLYLMGGYSGSYQNDTQYAQVNANGTLGSWITSSTFSVARGAQGVASYNGYLYIVAGTNGSVQNDARYAKIDPAGQSSAYSTTTSITSGSFTTLTAAATVAYNGYIYVLGGFKGSGSTYQQDVEYNSISANGTLGASWTAGSSLLQGVGLTGAVVYNGYIYVVGGYDGSAATAYVQYAPVNANGTLGSWLYTYSSTSSSTPTASLTNAAYNHVPVAYNGYMYYRGVNGGANTSNFYAPINADGTIGSWNPVSSHMLNTARNFEQEIAYNGYMYVVGGDTSGTTSTNSVEYALICTGTNTTGGCSGQLAGYLGTWNSTTSMNVPRDHFGLSIINGYMYAIGGTNSGTDVNSTEYAPINADGTLGTWTGNTSLPATVSNAAFASYNGYIYTISGKVAGARASTSYYGFVNNGGSGVTNGWTSSGSLPSAYTSGGLAGARMFASGGYMYLVGGWNGSTIYGASYYAPINTSGSLGSWTATSSFASSQTRYDFGLAVYNGYVYAVGGGTSSGGDYATTQYAAISPSGGLGTWQISSTSFTNSRTYPAVAVYNGYLYLMGGTHSGSYYNDIQYAALNASTGAVGSWSTGANSFTTSRYGAEAVAYNGYVYLAGGRTTTSGTYLTDVQYTPLNASTGAPGSWSYATALIQPRAYFALRVANGYMYAVGGTNTAGSLTDTEAVPIGAGGALGTWQASSGGVLSSDRSDAAATIYNGTLYISGGYSGATYRTDEYYTALSVQPRIGHYSKLIDLTTSTSVTSIVTDSGNSMLPASAIAYRAAGTNGVLGSSALTSSISGGCSTNLTATRYVWVSVTLDDSYGLGTGGVYADALGAATSGNVINANIATITVNYNATHPAPNIRLRGGQTLQSGTLSALDTCYP